MEGLEQVDWNESLQKVTWGKRIIIIDLTKKHCKITEVLQMSWDCPAYMYDKLRLLASFVFSLTSPKLHLATYK